MPYNIMNYFFIKNNGRQTMVGILALILIISILPNCVAHKLRSTSPYMEKADG